MFGFFFIYQTNLNSTDRLSYIFIHIKIKKKQFFGHRYNKNNIKKNNFLVIDMYYKKNNIITQTIKKSVTTKLIRARSIN